MRAVDTNIIVRFLVRDSPKQAAKAAAIIGHEPVFVPRTVMLEAEWVLRSVYGMEAKQIIPALRNLAGLPGITVEDSPFVARAMVLAEGGMDFADALHVAACGGCTGFLTFDKRLARSSRSVRGVAITLL